LSASLLTPFNFYFPPELPKKCSFGHFRIALLAPLDRHTKQRVHGLFAIGEGYWDITYAAAHSSKLVQSPAFFLLESVLYSLLYWSIAGYDVNERGKDRNDRSQLTSGFSVQLLKWDGVAYACVDRSGYEGETGGF